jgi:hypothetical protein
MQVVLLQDKQSACFVAPGSILASLNLYAKIAQQFVSHFQAPRNAIRVHMTHEVLRGLRSARLAALGGLQQTGTRMHK